VSGSFASAERRRGPSVADGFEDDPVRLDALAASERKFSAIEAARDTAFSAIDAWVCGAPAAAYDRALEAARRRLVARAAAAAGRGIALEYAALLGGEDGRRRVVRRFFGAPWPSADVDSATSALLDRLVERASELGAARIDDGGGRFDLRAAPVHCALGPLAMR